MPEQFKPYNFDQARDEATKMQEKIKRKEVDYYSSIADSNAYKDAEQLIENEKAAKNFELSPEQIEKIMEKIKNIHEYGTAYTTVLHSGGANPGKDLEDFLSRKNMKDRGNSQRFYFLIAGRIPTLEDKVEITPYCQDMFTEGGITVVFDLKNKIEVSEMVRTDDSKKDVYEVQWLKEGYHMDINIAKKLGIDKEECKIKNKDLTRIISQPDEFEAKFKEIFGDDLNFVGSKGYKEKVISVNERVRSIVKKMYAEFIEEKEEMKNKIIEELKAHLEKDRLAVEKKSNETESYIWRENKINYYFLSYEFEKKLEEKRAQFWNKAIEKVGPENFFIFAQTTEQGDWIADGLYGFKANGYLKNEDIEGIVITNKDFKTRNLVNYLKSHYKNTGENIFYPIYDYDGNLLWPKQMSYEEVKKFVTERDKKKKEVDPETSSG